jgi:coenzyme Q-binding protein COQ10
MPSFRTTRRVRHAAGEMFDLVADVERYPEFVPLCERLKVKRRAEGGEGTQILVADMTVAYGPVRQSFTSQVTLDRARLAILVEYLDGPFRQLENRWRFRPIGEKSCEVDFFISYEFRSKTLGLLMGAAFDRAFRRFAEAFEQRADKIYGVKSA